MNNEEQYRNRGPKKDKYRGANYSKTTDRQMKLWGVG